MLTTEPSAAPSTVPAAPKNDPTTALVAAAAGPGDDLVDVDGQVGPAGGSATGSLAVAAAVRASATVRGGGPAGRGGCGYSAGGRRCAGSGAIRRDGDGVLLRALLVSAVVGLRRSAASWRREGRAAVELGRGG
jgi:hypothetical protein